MVWPDLSSVWKEAKNHWTSSFFLQLFSPNPYFKTKSNPFKLGGPFSAKWFFPPGKIHKDIWIFNQNTSEYFLFNILFSFQWLRVRGKDQSVFVLLNGPAWPLPWISHSNIIVVIIIIIIIITLNGRAWPLLWISHSTSSSSSPSSSPSWFIMH